MKTVFKNSKKDEMKLINEEKRADEDVDEVSKFLNQIPPDVAKAKRHGVII
jgi:hypothetical protein